jgi:hypothetical protein
MSRVVQLILGVLLIGLAIGCGGGGDDGAGALPPTVDITGTWDASIIATGGTAVPVGFQQSGVMTMIQSGSTASGTFSTTLGGVGQISGTVSGDEFSFTAINQAPNCPGTFNGISMANATGDQMSGTYAGSDCLGTYQASFTASKR